MISSRLLPFTILTLTTFVIASADMDIGGFIDTYQSFGLKNNHDFMGSRTRLRLEGDFSYADAWAFVSVNAVYNGVVEKETGLNVREAFVGYAGKHFDFKAGNQIIIWGRSDGLYVTDNVSPKDYSEALARDFDDMRIPVTALRARALLDMFTCEFVWLPIFTPAVVPYQQKGVQGEWDDNPWAVSLPAGVCIHETEYPAKNLENSEIGARISMSGSVLDMSMSVLYTWDDIPAMHLENNWLYMQHHRLSIYGFDMSIPVWVLVIRGEAAFTEGSFFLSESGSARGKNKLTGLLGLDISPGNDWSISTQIYDRFILEHSSDLTVHKHDLYLTLSISKELFRNNLNQATSI